MLKIKCDHCGATLKGQDVYVIPFNAYIDGVKYKDYTAHCIKCDGVVIYDRYVQKAEENKAKAIEKVARKKGKTVSQVSEEEQYLSVMRKVGKRAREIAAARTTSPAVRITDVSKAVHELPQDEKDFMLAYEEKQDMALLDQKYDKPTDHIKVNSILLWTQAIIESAIADNDEDFFKSKYGAHIVETYNAALAVHKCHDYGITAALLLDKMRKGKFAENQEEDEENE